ncbi:MAG: DUF2024 domain-containing protein [Alphaproteobacteria bacterium CG_4_9_14_3_um_filter_47_13]|nr:MAG: DUF2024 domain-containing protein [Alphaproteobacteria bacterium CG_4_9_14_3_um_filter_47_13]
MKIDVYDTYATSKNGNIMHFDVFIPNGENGDKAFQYAKIWLSDIGQNADDLDQARCRFCHSEMANPEIEREIKAQGYYILQMEGCPNAIR